MSFRIAVDTGGTFTDVVVTDDHGRQWDAKASTTPDDVFQGMRGALARAAGSAGIGLDALLSGCHVLTYATTHATNAIITARTARTAFLTTEGHPDILMLREGGRFGPFDYTQEYPPPYVPRALTFEIPERLSEDGTVLRPLDETQARSVIARLCDEDVEAAGVCLLWAHVYPAHEQRLAELFHEDAPHISVSLSHRVVPIIREYRRASATCIDASLKPLMTKHFASIGDQLRSHGFRGELLAVTSTGGVVPVHEAAAKPVLVVNSGPSIAPIGGQAAATEESTSADLVIGDMGGTTFDISLVQGGRVHFARETWLGGQFVGHITGLPSVGVESIGYGGGSIALVDEGGMLRVGPQSVGAVPGPACYGQGGTLATFTDAAVTVGYIDPSAFLGGTIQLSREAAEQAIREHVAEPLGMDLGEAAAAVMEVAVDAMTERTREAMAREGIDPEEAVFIAGGGASGLCAGEIGRRLGCRSVLVPSTGPVLSASGGLHSDMVMEFSASHATTSTDFDETGVNRTLDELTREMDAFFDRLAADDASRTHEFIVEARYRHQVWELEVPLTTARVSSAAGLQELVDAFHMAHERVYGVRDANQAIEFLYWRGRARARTQRPDRLRAAGSSASSTPEKAHVFQADAGWITIPRLEGTAVEPGTPHSGPLLVDLPQSTLVVPSGMDLIRSTNGNFVLDEA